MKHCKNHGVCLGYAVGDGKNGLCAKCRKVARRFESDEAIEREHDRLNNKYPNRPTFREIEREQK